MNNSSFSNQQSAIVPSPTPAFDVSAITRANLQPSTKAKYTREVEAMHLAGVDPRNHSQLQSYADGLKSSRKQFLKSALRLMVQGIEQHIKANATPENLPQVQASLYRLDAMKNAVNVPQHKGVKAHTWLSRAQVVHITGLCGDSLEGKRDWIILGLLLGAGLRREELSQLTFDCLKTQPTKNGARVVVEVKHGKGNKSRVIPISAKLASRLHEWKEITAAAPFERVARAMTRKGELAESMDAVSIFRLVRKYGRKIGVPELAAHDCRRTFLQLGYEAGIPITQLSVLAGHSTVAVTQRYLNLALDLESTASDFIPLS